MGKLTGDGYSTEDMVALYLQPDWRGWEELGRLIPSRFGDRAQDCDHLFLTAERAVDVFRIVVRQYVVEGICILTCTEDCTLRLE